MSQFVTRYREYRRFGLRPLVAARLAWLVVNAQRSPLLARVAMRR